MVRHPGGGLTMKSQHTIRGVSIWLKPPATSMIKRGGDGALLYLSPCLPLPWLAIIGGVCQSCRKPPRFQELEKSTGRRNYYTIYAQTRLSMGGRGPPNQLPMWLPQTDFLGHSWVGDLVQSSALRLQGLCSWG